MGELRPVPSFFPDEDDICVFCRIVAGDLPATVIGEWADAIAIVPGGHGPVVPDGHVLIIPKVHVRDMTTDAVVTGVVAQRAAELANAFGVEHGQFAFNLGEHGGQTVWHLHGHLVIADAEHLHTMPWFGQLLRGDRRYFVAPDGDGEMALWLENADRPDRSELVVFRHDLDALDPLFWTVITRVLPYPAPLAGGGFRG